MSAAVQEIDKLCCELYESSNYITRTNAERKLTEIILNSDCLQQSCLLLDQSKSPFTQLFASNAIGRFVSKSPPESSVQARIDLRNYLLNFLYQNSTLPNYVTNGLVQAHSKLIKHSWNDVVETTSVFHDVVDQSSNFLRSGSNEHMCIGVLLLSNLVGEMNESESSRHFMKHRRIASSFRDGQLLNIFQLSIQLLRAAEESMRSGSITDDQRSLLQQSLNLSYSCLSFDFIGSSTDESSDELATVQVPGTWKSAFMDPLLVKLFYDIFKQLYQFGSNSSRMSSKALSCIVQLASVRRSLFQNVERTVFLSRLVAGSKELLMQPQSLAQPDNCHEFCRLLARLKTNYQLGELIACEGYEDWLRLLASFTVSNLQSIDFSPNSLHYLLSLWQRMIASVPYIKSSEPHRLDMYAPLVVQTYIESRVEGLAVIVRDGMENPLDDASTISQQMDQMSTICRCEYQQTCEFLIKTFTTAAQAYENLRIDTINEQTFVVCIGRLAWLVYLVGSAIGGRISFSSTDLHDELDGSIVSRVIQLMSLSDRRLNIIFSSNNENVRSVSEHLETAFMYFFEQFRKIYVGDQVPKSGKLYHHLADSVGLSDEAMVLGVFVNKIVTNLKYWGASESVVSKTLYLFNDLSVGYTSVRKLVKLDAVQFILNNHTVEQFPMLGISQVLAKSSSAPPILRSRTTFYTALVRLLLVDLSENEARFEEFMKPIQASLDEILSLFESHGLSHVAINNSNAKLYVMGLARDLRGIAFACNTKTSFAMLFKWIYPSVFYVFYRAISLWYADPLLTTSVLKCVSELTHNRTQRLQFDITSPNGILLFREISKIVTTYSTLSLQSDQIPNDARLKGVTICMNILKASLCSNSVNFGVFRFYGDDSLENALLSFVDIVIQLPKHSIQLFTYPKASQQFYSLVEVLAQDHLYFLTKLNTDYLVYILEAVADGVNSIDTMISTCCCSILDSVASHTFRQLRQQQQPPASRRHYFSPDAPTDPIAVINLAGDVIDLASDNIFAIFARDSSIFERILSLMLGIVMLDECRNQWSLSRPLLALILVNEAYFEKLRSELVEQQAPSKRQVVSNSLTTLMDSIERNLSVKNRDKFTQNLSVFRREIFA